MGKLTHRIDPAAVIRDGANRGLLLAAEHVLQVSNTRVPIEEGTLERSGATSIGDLEASTSYSTPYAARQHEELTWQHDKGRRSKFLESASIDEKDTVAAIMAKAARDALGQ